MFGALESDGLRRRMAMNNEVPPERATEGDASSQITCVLPVLWSSAAVATLRQSQGPDRLQAVRKRAPTPPIRPNRNKAYRHDREQKSHAGLHCDRGSHVLTGASSVTDAENCAESATMDTPQTMATAIGTTSGADTSVPIRRRKPAQRHRDNRHERSPDLVSGDPAITQPSVPQRWSRKQTRRQWTERWRSVGRPRTSRTRRSSSTWRRAPTCDRGSRPSPDNTPLPEDGATPVD